MDREEFRKYLIPFSDGSIEPEMLDEVKEHVESCAESAAEVEEVRRLKKRLARAFEQEKPSSELQQRICDAIAVEADRVTVNVPTRSPKWPIPLGIAAAVAVVWAATQFMPQSDLHRQNNSTPTVLTSYAGEIRERHFGCTKIGSAHQRAHLERDLETIAAVLGSELGFTITAPDLTELGYRFHSADNCGFAGVPASHIVYQRMSDGRYVSLFCTARMSDLADAEEFKRGFRNYLVNRESGSATVAAWHDGQRTHILCGRIDLEQLMVLADAIE